MAFAIPMKLTLKVRGAVEAGRAVEAAGERAIRAMVPVVERVSKYVAAATFRRSAFRTGFQREHIRRRITEKGLAYEVGWEAADFHGAGKAFYPPYNEFGTSRQRAQPALIPSQREGVAMLKRELAKAIRAAVQRGAR